LLIYINKIWFQRLWSKSVSKSNFTSTSTLRGHRRRSKSRAMRETNGETVAGVHQSHQQFALEEAITEVRQLIGKIKLRGQ
jgi:hypothetical protein